jgi:Endoribonuclease GhoS
MASYIARVELHSATWEDYDTLHASMERRGYSRTIASDGGVIYQLPTGTYVAGNSNADINVALSAAVEAANETGKRSSIIVTDWTAAKWNGLSKTPSA